MKQDNAKARLRILGGVMALFLVILAGLLLYALTSGLFGSDTADTLPRSAGQDELTMRDDLWPDMDSLYKAWDLSFEQANGQAVRLSAYRGKPLALAYWNSWCPDCKSMIGMADQAANAARAAGGQLILVARGGVREETAQSAAMYLASIGMAQPTLLDPDAGGYTQLGLHWVPTVLYFDASGVLMYADTGGDLSPAAVRAGLAYAQRGGREATEALVRNQLMDAQGRVAGAFTLGADSAVAPLDTALSETQGLMMLYALKAGDQTLFDLAYGYVRDGLSLANLAAWRRDGQTLADTNATLDDLRIAGALYDANEHWGGYEAQLRGRTEAMAARLIQDDYLLDYTQLGGEQSADTMTLCYADLMTLAKLASLDNRFAPVEENAKTLLLGGRISDEFPLLYPRYSLQTLQYEAGEIHTAEAMLALLHLAQADLLPEDTIVFLTDWVRGGPLFARYSVQGEALSGYVYESTATYAILVILGCETNHPALVKAALYRMERFRRMLNGAYAYEGENATFDTLYALLAWQALEDCGFQASLRE
ncbi:MAG TPA: glycosyl hydrolase family 8 [Candidatus Limiplasma sp.]|nr:glycosyl hydrolase family 8 [Candidatus Limiplasma sp.]HRX07840.1 glycosyl hydrolase family 8 [Candidatus Limiplasma sp.]